MLSAPNTFQYLLITKLTGENYTLRASQFKPLLISYDLYGYIDGSKTKPAKVITQDGKQVSNPEYVVWRRHDQLLS